MKKICIASILGVTVCIGSVQAQSLQPQMSAQDVASQIEVDQSHVIVPILMMVFLVATATGNGGGVIAPSDARVKTDIHPVDQTAHGLTLYEFRYRGHAETWRGVMAQEVAEVMPDAVQRHDTGYLMVDYGALGITMDRVD
jgi:hypothetical protein